MATVTFVASKVGAALSENFVAGRAAWVANEGNSDACR